jgi:hypothetical protein
MPRANWRNSRNQTGPLPKFDNGTRNYHKRYPTGYYSNEATIQGRDWRVAMLKYLRIAVTALSLTACVLLVAMWVRSYIRTGTSLYVHSRGYSFDSDELLRVAPNSHLSGITSQRGLVTAAYIPNFDLFNASLQTGAKFTPVVSLLGIGIVRYPSGGGSLNLPHWSLLVLFSVFAAVPWIPWWSRRFSLRTLLIATTLVAVVLGIIVAAR